MRAPCAAPGQQPFLLLHRRCSGPACPSRFVGSSAMHAQRVHAPIALRATPAAPAAAAAAAAAPTRFPAPFFDRRCCCCYAGSPPRHRPNHPLQAPAWPAPAPCASWRRRRRSGPRAAARASPPAAASRRRFRRAPTRRPPTRVRPSPALLRCRPRRVPRNAACLLRRAALPGRQLARRPRCPVTRLPCPPLQPRAPAPAPAPRRWWCRCRRRRCRR